MHATGHRGRGLSNCTSMSMRLWVLLREQDMRPSSCTATRECTPARAHIREASKLSPLSLSHSNLSLLSRATDLQHRMACGVQLGQYCSASSSLSLSLALSLSLSLHSYVLLLFSPYRERVCVCRDQRVTSAWPRALLWLSGSLL